MPEPLFEDDEWAAEAAERSLVAFCDALGLFARGLVDFRELLDVLGRFEDYTGGVLSDGAVRELDFAHYAAGRAAA